jgi:hypothetical protein
MPNLSAATKALSLLLHPSLMLVTTITCYYQRALVNSIPSPLDVYMQELRSTEHEKQSWRSQYSLVILQENRTPTTHFNQQLNGKQLFMW